MTSEAEQALKIDGGLAVRADSPCLEDLRRAYRDQDELVFLESFVQPGLLDALSGDVERVRPELNRNHVPGFKKGGSVSYFTIRRAAPAIHALYHSSAVRDFVSALTGEEVLTCPENDPHACALYFYTEPGDRIGWHYDTSHYAGRRYTLLVGIEDRSSSELVCRLFTKTNREEERELRIRTRPGSLAIFNGDTIYHSVTPCAENEERIILTLEYVADRSMPFHRRLISNIKDAVGYFGWKVLFGK